MSRKKLGVYGGTFSPPHLGHVRAAEAFASALDLDELLIIPAYVPPHKAYNDEASAKERLEMARLAFANVPKARVSDMEIVRGGKSFTYLTLEQLTSVDTDIYLLCGTDMFLTLDEWRESERIFNLATVCYVRREDDECISKRILDKKNEYFSKYSAKIIEIDVDVTEVSSTDIRLDLANCNSSEFLCDSVLEYIRSRGLYS